MTTSAVPPSLPQPVPSDAPVPLPAASVASAAAPPDRSVGERMRRQVMGDVFVDRAHARATGFDAPLQDLVQDHAWGATWQRAGLTLKERSLCTVAMLAALGHHHELKGHLRGALNNGASLAELREVLLHVGPYAGVPNAVAAFRAAREWMDEQGLSLDAAPPAA